MTQRKERARTEWLVFSAALLMGLAVGGVLPEHARAERYPAEMMLHGAPVESKVSGYSGSRRKLEVDDDKQAVYGISSQERRDNPCTFWIGTESINDSNRTTGDIKNLCGGTPKSSPIKAQYRDDMYSGRRVFVTGIRVCTNNRETRVKGFQLRGKQIQDDGRLADLIYPIYPPPSGPVRYYLVGGANWNFTSREKYANDSDFPADFRNNCKQWHKWAECPQANQVATGVIAHFEAGKEPRSLTGVAVQCRYVSGSTSPPIADGDHLPSPGVDGLA